MWIKNRAAEGDPLQNFPGRCTMLAANIRLPARAGSFYPATRKSCELELAACRAKATRLPAELSGSGVRRIFGGVVPHAGWSYSGPTALAVFDALAIARPRPETAILFATSHRSDVHVPSLQASGAWRSPSGDAPIDTELARAMLEEAGGAHLLADAPLAHEGDHAIEVQLPLLLDALPGTRFVPVAMPFGTLGPEVGRAAARAAKRVGRRVVALASTDLTHYGPNHYGFAPKGVGMDAHRWSKEVNDRRFLERVLALDATGAYAAAAEDHSACGPAAAAAAIAFALDSGASKGLLLEHITSWERMQHEQGEPEDFVGYAGVVFV